MPMDIAVIKEKVHNGEYIYSSHADAEREAENLTLTMVKQAVLNGEILKQYPDTGRGESCLVLGFADGQPIQIVCGWREDKIVFITVYIPRPPKFIDPRTRGAAS